MRFTILAVALLCFSSWGQNICPGDFRTQTQGGWGAAADGNNPGVYRDQNFAAAFPQGLVIGADALGIDGHSALFLTAAAIEAFLPQEGQPAKLTKDHIDPTATEAGVLGGQAVALTLSVGFDRYDPNFGKSCILLAELVIADQGNAWYGKSVQEVLDEANRVLAGLSSTNASEISDTLAKINQTFVDGKTVNTFLELPPIEPGDFKTYTQDDWGADAGDATTYLLANFAATFPNGLSIGAEPLGISGFSATFTTPEAIVAFLPQIGEAAAFTQSHTDPVTTEAGELAGEAVALTLNIQFDRIDSAFSMRCILLADLVVADSTSPCVGMSVQAVLNEINKILSGGVSTLTPAQAAECARRINENFRAGTVNEGYLTYPSCNPDGNNGGDDNDEIEIVESMSLQVSFKQEEKDSLKMKGELSLSEDFKTECKEVEVDVGGAVLVFKLDKKGQAREDRKQFKLSRRKDTWSYSLKVSKSTLSNQWSSEGVKNEDIKRGEVKMPVEITVGGTHHETSITLTYSSKEGKSGRGK